MTIPFHIHHIFSIIHSFVFRGCIYAIMSEISYKKPAEPESKIGVFDLGDKLSDKII